MYIGAVLAHCELANYYLAHTARADMCRPWTGPPRPGPHMTGIQPIFLRDESRIKLPMSQDRDMGHGSCNKKFAVVVEFRSP